MTSNHGSFPTGFIWGAAAAAHQVEGHNTNSDCWLEENVPGSPYVDRSGDAVDHLHRYREDIALMAGLGLVDDPLAQFGRDVLRRGHAPAFWQRRRNTSRSALLAALSKA